MIFSSRFFCSRLFTNLFGLQLEVPAIASVVPCSTEWNLTSGQLVDESAVNSLIFYCRNGGFVSICDSIRLPDDVAVGFLSGAKGSVYYLDSQFFPFPPFHRVHLRDYVDPIVCAALSSRDAKQSS